MKNYRIEQEVVLTSEYVHIIQSIILTTKRYSLIKTLIFAYIIHQQKYYLTNIYDGKTKYSSFLKCISEISGKYKDFCANISFIMQAVDILAGSKNIAISGSKITYLRITTANEVNDKFILLAIEESKKISDRQVLKEILRNV